MKSILYYVAITIAVLHGKIGNAFCCAMQHRKWKMEKLQYRALKSCVYIDTNRTT